MDENEIPQAAKEYIRTTYVQNPDSDGTIYDGGNMQDVFYAGALWEREREQSK
jgi:hypothetical protein